MVERIILRRTKNQEVVVMDMVSTPDYILKSVDWGVVKGTHHSYKYVNQVGETVANTSLGTRPIKIEIVLKNPFKKIIAIIAIAKVTIAIEK